MTTPRIAACHILQPRFGLEVTEMHLPLAEFQREAVARARAILEQRGGVLVADVVGLGKTFVGLGVIELCPDHVLVVVPASLKSMWRRELRRLPGVGVEMLSHSAIGLGRRPAISPSLVVIDEAHGFRNPKTRRYRNLAQICAGVKVVLLTATPVNNSLRDLCALLSLFLRDSALRDLGIGSLRLSLTIASPSMRDLELIHRAVIIRRRRNEVRESAPPTFRFPTEITIQTIEHKPVVSVESLRAILDALTFPAYQRTGVGKGELLRYAFLKRAGSSRHALSCTLQRQIRFYEQFIDALRRGVSLDPRGYRSLYSQDDFAMQLVFDEFAFPPQRGDSDSLLEECVHEQQRFIDWRNMLPHDDDKLRALRDLLRERRGNKTIVFTEYRDTARYLWRALRTRYACGLIDGEGAWLGENRSTRRDVVDRFAPEANHARIHRREACDVLIATDVLAEGMNLQDADGVVSYDLPWNPVRLMQRAGRIDRIGSPHSLVRVFNFIPNHDFDQLIGLVRTLERKLETVRSVVGLDRPVLADELFEIMGTTSSDACGLKQKYSSPPPADGIPVGATGERTVLVGAARGQEWACYADVDGSITELADPIADLKLTLAIDVTEARDLTNPFMDRVGKVVERVLADLWSRNDLARVDLRGMGARVVRALNERLAAEPLMVDPELFRRADRIQARLNEGLSLVEDEALGLVLSGNYEEASQLLEALETVLRPCEIGDDVRPCWRITGVLVLD